MKKTDFDFVNGETLLFDKALKWTSFDLVKKVRNLVGIKKVGHAGTLDPLATGLLIICTGKNTKKIEDIQNAPKEYTGTITLGGTTPSFDLETEILETFSLDGISEEVILETAASFVGEHVQVPPIYSAVKVNGVRAYEHARKGEEVKLKERTVLITEFEVTGIELPLVHFRITCSKGTYIRSIANDFGKLLNNGGHLSSLKRTKIGENRIEDAYTIEDFMKIMKEDEGI